MGYISTGRPTGRPKQFQRYEIPRGVVKIVSAQCADFSRKELAIRDGRFSEGTLATYMDVNAAISSKLADDQLMIVEDFSFEKPHTKDAVAALKALGADIEEVCRESFLLDIAENRGYEKSQIGTLFSRRAYYNRKRKAIYDIARLLRLI